MKYLLELLMLRCSTRAFALFFVMQISLIAGPAFAANFCQDAAVLNEASELVKDRVWEQAPQCLESRLLSLRQAYVNEVKALADVALCMTEAGAPSEHIARQLHRMRRDLGVRFKDLTPASQLEVIHQRNLERYGDKSGPTIDWLRAKGKSWEQIIESASRPGGKDLGF